MVCIHYYVLYRVASLPSKSSVLHLFIPLSQCYVNFDITLALPKDARNHLIDLKTTDKPAKLMLSDI